MVAKSALSRFSRMIGRTSTGKLEDIFLLGSVLVLDFSQELLWFVTASCDMEYKAHKVVVWCGARIAWSELPRLVTLPPLQLCNPHLSPFVFSRIILHHVAIRAVTRASNSAFE
jgi:hypothetical protein